MMKRYGGLFFSLVFLFAFPVSSPSFWPEQWSLRTPTLKGVVHGDGKWVAVGVSGGIYTSADRIHWEKQSSPTDQQLNRIIHTWNPGLFLAVGENGTILTSPDGVSWTKQTSNTGSSLYGIAYNGNNRFVAVGSTGTIVTSTDGTAWSSVSSGIIDSLNDVAYAASKFVAVGSRTTVLNSPDGLDLGEEDPGMHPEQHPGLPGRGGRKRLLRGGGRRHLLLPRRSVVVPRRPTPPFEILTTWPTRAAGSSPREVPGNC